MTNHVSAMRKIVAGVEVSSGHLYGQWLTFDKIVSIINDALNSVEPDHEGNIVFKYESRVKTTTPYRTLTIEQPRYVPDRWYVVKDTGHNSFGGLEVIRFVNIHKMSEQPRIHRDKKTGLMFEIVKPKGWK